MTDNFKEIRSSILKLFKENKLDRLVYSQISPLFDIYLEEDKENLCNKKIKIEHKKEIKLRRTDEEYLKGLIGDKLLSIGVEECIKIDNNAKRPVIVQNSELLKNYEGRLKSLNDTLKNQFSILKESKERNLIEKNKLEENIDILEREVDKLRDEIICHKKNIENISKEAWALERALNAHNTIENKTNEQLKESNMKLSTEIVDLQKRLKDMGNEKVYKEIIENLKLKNKFYEEKINKIRKENFENTNKLLEEIKIKECKIVDYMKKSTVMYNEISKKKQIIKQIDREKHNYMKDMSSLLSKFNRRGNELKMEVAKNAVLSEDLQMMLNIVNEYNNGDRRAIKDIYTENEYLRKTLRCNICNINNKDTVLLKCMHSFCKTCIDDRIEKRERKCPFCGKLFLECDVKKIYL